LKTEHLVCHTIYNTLIDFLTHVRTLHGDSVVHVVAKIKGRRHIMQVKHDE